MIEAIKDFIFVQLKPNELEESFRTESFKRDKTQTITVMAITLILILMFIGLDISLWQENKIHPLWIPSRIIASLASLIGIWLVHHQSGAQRMDRITLWVVLIDICHLLIINLTRVNDYVPVIVWDILTIMGIYFFVPFPFHYKIVTALFLTGSSSVIWCIYRIPLVNPYETIAVLAAYIFSNIYGIFVSRWDNQVRRQRYVSLMNEMETRRNLSDRTTELEKTKEELQLLAMTDHLTGISNRRNFMSKTSEELERIKRYGYPLSLMVLDIDHFKEINDTYGHKAGDEVLRLFATHCLSQLRALDQFARFGGDEFIALLVQTGQDDAKEVAERIRTSIEDLEIQINQEIITTTVSVGLTTTKDDVTSAEELIKRADKALYDAKNGGRNQVAVM